ncbi:hypothetical protein F0562_010713 [Nyssa sinensis]|uniref:Uncharacterized protein n=1 Tax=Nyssa sinensis TaxID=561372 RepID=A0A5J5A1G7_9ASTE|nr:hypothetical protein F0562_010713 [Nyssa sinensis]
MRNRLFQPQLSGKRIRSRDYQSAKFRMAGLEHRDEMEILFSRIAATGEHAWAPSFGVMPNVEEWSGNIVFDDNAYYPNHDNIPIDDDTPNANEPNVGEETLNFQEHSTKKITHLKGKQLSATRMEHQLDRLVEAVESTATTASSLGRHSIISVKDAMTMLRNLPVVDPCDDIVMVGANLLLKRHP